MRARSSQQQYTMPGAQGRLRRPTNHFAALTRFQKYTSQSSAGQVPASAAPAGMPCAESSEAVGMLSASHVSCEERDRSIIRCYARVRIEVSIASPKTCNSHVSNHQVLLPEYKRIRYRDKERLPSDGGGLKKSGPLLGTE